MESTWLLAKNQSLSPETVPPSKANTSIVAPVPAHAHQTDNSSSFLSPPVYSLSKAPADPPQTSQEPVASNAEKLFSAQVRVYFITFVAYAMSHYARKSYTFFKTTMNSEDGVPIELQGWMDSVFMLAYAIGSFFAGHLGDEFHPPTVVALGMLGAGTCVALLIATLWSGLVAESYFLAAFVLLLVWLCHGAFQSSGGPVNTVIMGNWFSGTHRGLIFGSWTCHQYTGNILGAITSSLMLGNHIQYYWALALPVAANFCWAAVVYFYLPARPEEIGLELDTHGNTQKHLGLHGGGTPQLHTPTPPQLSIIASPSILPHHRLPRTGVGHPSSRALSDNKPAITIAEALRIPMVSMYALAFGFFKLTNYTLFFWLPFFLSHSFSPSVANLISMLYDVGMMPGGVLVGGLSDWAGGRRTTVCVVMLVALCPLLLFFGAFSDTLPVPALLGLLGLLGILVGGPNNIITSAVAADLALHPAIAGNHRALGTVTGIINGSGSITAALGLSLVSWTQLHLGWMYVWGALVAGTLLGCGLLMPRVFEELRDKSDDYQPITIAVSEQAPHIQEDGVHTAVVDRTESKSN